MCTIAMRNYWVKKYWKPAHLVSELSFKDFLFICDCLKGSTIRVPGEPIKPEGEISHGKEN